MDLTGAQISFISMNVAVHSGGFLLPSNLIESVPAGGDFVVDIATKIAKVPRNGISVEEATSAINNALGGNISGVTRFGVTSSWIDLVWKPAEACYPSAFITDTTQFSF